MEICACFFPIPELKFVGYTAEFVFWAFLMFTDIIDIQSADFQAAQASVFSQKGFL